MNLNWLDYVLIALLGYSILRSFLRGFTREIIGLIAAVAALVLGMWFYGTAASFVRPWITSERGANFAGFLLVFFAVLLVGALIGSVVRRFVKAVGLSFFDRLLGAGFGLIRGSLIAVALLTAFMAFGPRADAKTAPNAVVHSQIAPYILKASSVFVDVAPEGLKRSFRQVYDEAQTEIKNITLPSKTGATN